MKDFIPADAVCHSFEPQTKTVVGKSYGSEGICPEDESCCDTSCVSSSGDSICGGYCGHTEVFDKDGNTFYLVKCQFITMKGNVR